MSIEMRNVPVPAVIRSRQHLAAQGIRLAPEGAVAPAQLPIAADGVTYSMAQEARWIDNGHFAVGRWDGSLSIFTFNNSTTQGPVINRAVNTPSFEGVQMITWLAPGVFCSSNDDSSMSVWAAENGIWKNLRQAATLQYDPLLGVVNSGESLALGPRLYLAAGHANGFVSLWGGSLEGTELQFLKAIDVRNPSPTNPWGIHNIRGIAITACDNSSAWVATGSEDGYICIVELPEGVIVSQTVFNPKAQRGINSVAALGQNLLIANCAVGTADKNLWLFTVDGKNGQLQLKDSTNLRVNPSAPQVFNFCTIWGWCGERPCFFSSTEEGALWMGAIDPSEHFTVFGYQNIYGNLGSALAFNVTGRLVAVNYNLYEFRISPQTGFSASAGNDPEQIPYRSWNFRNAVQK